MKNLFTPTYFIGIINLKDHLNYFYSAIHQFPPVKLRKSVKKYTYFSHRTLCFWAFNGISPIAQEVKVNGSDFITHVGREINAVAIKKVNKLLESTIKYNKSSTQTKSLKCQRKDVDSNDKALENLPNKFSLRKRLFMNAIHHNKSLVKSELHHYFIRLAIYTFYTWTSYNYSFMGFNKTADSQWM